MSQSRKKLTATKKRGSKWLALLLLIPVALIIATIFFNSKDDQSKLPTNNRGGGTTETQIYACQMKLKQLVKSHPDPRISKDLDSLIVNGIIFNNFQALTPEEMGGVATFCLVYIEGRGYAPTLNFHISEIMNHNLPDQYKQLVILHEYAHFLQWAKKIVPENHFYYGAAPDYLDEKEAKGLFEIESQAYLMESQFACRQGWSHHFDISAAYCGGGLIGMRRRLAERYSIIPEFAPFRSLLFKLSADTTKMLPPI